jgi:hypothetical protein
VIEIMRRAYRFVIENESGIDIKLEIFESGNNSLVKNILIPDSDFVVKDFQSSDMDKVYGIQDFFEGDSVNVIYGNAVKIESYRCEFLKPENNGCGKPGNIANDGNPRWKRERQGKFYKRIYTFMPKDYENETPCDGSCN